jgi:hypothetical protein
VEIKHILLGLTVGCVVGIFGVFNHLHGKPYKKTLCVQVTEGYETVLARKSCPDTKDIIIVPKEFSNGDF